MLQVVLLDIFLKVAVSCKIKPAAYVIKESHPLLARLTHDEFSSQLLPAIQKAMLRNPEVILPSVGQLLQGLTLDLSQYALDIGKSLARTLCIFLYDFLVGYLKITFIIWKDLFLQYLTFLKGINAHIFISV